ncbi:hypothetical protein IKQ26_09190 [bacterium]|nr:hypothetical protein [bacterium]
MFISPIGAGNYYKPYSMPKSAEKKNGADNVSFKALLRDPRSAEELRQIALRERYGNTEISMIEPEVIFEAKERLKEMGIKDIQDKNIYVIVEDAPYDREHDKYHIISYYDESKQASIRFTNDGDRAYMVKYNRTPDGVIKDCYFDQYYDFYSKKWRPVSGPLF